MISKIFGWILSLTKVGKITEPIQAWLSGKKVYLAGSALAIPAIITIVMRFSEQGMPYLLTVTTTPEWIVLMNGLAAMGLRAAVTKAADPSKDPNAQ